jgi:predicted metallopeptidase
MISYDLDFETKRAFMEIITGLRMTHIDPERVVCVRSRDSKSRKVLARCHVLPRIMQKALDMKAHYVIELVSEKYDKLDEEEKTKTLIHELLHIPKAFGGGFRYHDYVSKRTVERLYEKLKESR